MGLEKAPREGEEKPSLQEFGGGGQDSKAQPGRIARVPV